MATGDFLRESGTPLPLNIIAEPALHRLASISVRASDNFEIKGPRPWIDVRAYGALGDGTSDDTAAIQSALDAVPVGGAVVWLSSGTYRITSSLSISRSSLTVLGVNAEFTASVDFDVFQVSDGVEDLTVVGLFMVAPQQRNGDFVQQIGGTRTTIIRCRAVGLPLYNLSKSVTGTPHSGLLIVDCMAELSPTNGVYLSGCTNSVIVGCTFVDNASDGVKLGAQPCDKVTIRDCVFESNGDDAVDLFGGGSNLVIEGCKLIGNRLALKNMGGQYFRPDVQYATVRNCVFDGDCGFEILTAYIPWTEERKSIVGDNVTAVFQLTHTLGRSGAYIGLTLWDNVGSQVTAGFTATTPDSSTVTVTFDNAPASGTVYYALLHYALPHSGDLYTQSLTDGSTSATVVHNLGTERVDVRVYGITQTEVTPQAVLITDQDTVQLTFSTALGPGHHVTVRKQYMGLYGVRVEGCVFENATAGYIFTTNGAVQFEFVHNVVRNSTVDAVINIRTPLKLGLIADNLFDIEMTAQGVYHISVQGQSDPVFGLEHPDSSLIVQRNYLRGGRRAFTANYTKLDCVARDNELVDLLDDPSYQSIGITTYAQGYRGVIDNNIIRKNSSIERLTSEGVASLPPGTTEPVVYGYDWLRTANSSVTTVTNFVKGHLGQQITLLAADANTTVQNNTNIRLAGGVDFVMATGDTLTLAMIEENSWYEISRKS